MNSNFDDTQYLNKKVKVTIKNFPKDNTIHPFNNTAQKFCSLLGKSTFTKRDLFYIKELGYEVQQVQVTSEGIETLAYRSSI